MNSKSSSQQALISSLLSEKDRLITEKDELVASKDSLWRGLHQVICEKNAEIAKLTESKKALTSALQGLLDKNSGPQAKETKGRTGTHIREPDQDGIRADTWDAEGESALFESISDETAIKIEDSHDGTPMSSHSARRPLVASSISQKSFPSFDTYVTAPREPSRTYDRSDEGLKDSVLRKYEFRSLISINNDGDYETGKIEGVAAPVVNSILATFAEIERRSEHGIKKSPHPNVRAALAKCAWMWSTETSTTWTASFPGKFVCAPCFNARRACFKWQGHMRWLLLPLPPSLRHSDATSSETRYHIYQGSGVASSFEGVWKHPGGQRSESGRR